VCGGKQERKPPKQGTRQESFNEPYHHDRVNSSRSTAVVCFIPKRKPASKEKKKQENIQSNKMRNQNGACLLVAPQDPGLGLYSSVIDNSSRRTDGLVLLTCGVIMIQRVWLIGIGSISRATITLIVVVVVVLLRLTIIVAAAARKKHQGCGPQTSKKSSHGGGVQVSEILDM
jgi:hypothetical protein